MIGIFWNIRPWAAGIQLLICLETQQTKILAHFVIADILSKIVCSNCAKLTFHEFSMNEFWEIEFRQKSSTSGICINNMLRWAQVYGLDIQPTWCDRHIMYASPVPIDLVPMLPMPVGSVVEKQLPLSLALCSQ